MLEEALRFFYTRTYAAVRRPEGKPLLFNVHMAALADFLLAPKLLECATSACLQNLKANMSISEATKVIPFVFEGNRSSDRQLKARLISICVGNSFAESVKLIEPASEGLGPGQSMFMPWYLDSFTLWNAEAEGTISAPPAKKQKMSEEATAFKAHLPKAQGPTKSQMVAQVLGVLFNEEPVAFTTEVVGRRTQRVLERQLESSISEREKLEEQLAEEGASRMIAAEQATREIKKMRTTANTNLYKFADSLLKCRNIDCRSTSLIMEKTAEGRVKGFKCAHCNTMHYVSYYRL